MSTWRSVRKAVGPVLDFGQRAFATTSAIVTVYLSVDIGYRLYNVRSTRQAFEQTEEGALAIAKWREEHPDPANVTATQQLQGLKDRGVQPVYPTKAEIIAAELPNKNSAGPTKTGLLEVPVVPEHSRREQLRKAREEYAAKKNAQ